MRAYIIASILIIVGLASIAFKGTLEPANWLLPYLNDFSSALLVGGILSLLFKIFQDKESEGTLRRLMRIHDSVDELGLTEILSESQAFNFTSLIKDSDSLSIVMNDGLRWVGNNTVSLRERFSTKSTTEMFTVDPSSSFAICLAEKTEIELQDLKKKIEDTWKRMKECYEDSDKKGELVIYALKTYPTRSVFLSESLLIETPYQIAAGRTNVPVFVYRSVARLDSPHAFAKRDIEALRSESKEIFNSKTLTSAST